MADGKAPNRNCVVCDKAYYFCACHRNTNRAVWNMNCCTPFHFQVFLIALDVRDGNITPEDAKRQLAKLNFYKKDLSWCNDATRSILTPVFERKRAVEAKEQEKIGEGE